MPTCNWHEYNLTPEGVQETFKWGIATDDNGDPQYTFIDNEAFDTFDLGEGGNQKLRNVLDDLGSDEVPVALYRMKEVEWDAAEPEGARLLETSSDFYLAILAVPKSGGRVVIYDATGEFELQFGEDGLLLGEPTYNGDEGYEEENGDDLEEEEIPPHS